MVPDAIVLVCSLVAITVVIFATAASICSFLSVRRQRRLQGSLAGVEDSQLVRKMTIHQGKVVDISVPGRGRQSFNITWPISMSSARGKILGHPRQTRPHNSQGLATREDGTAVSPKDLEDQPLHTSESNMKMLDSIDERFGTTKPAPVQMAKSGDIGQDLYWQQTLSQIIGRERPRSTSKGNNDLLNIEKVSGSRAAYSSRQIGGAQNKNTSIKKTGNNLPLSVWNRQNYDRTSPNSSVDSAQSLSGNFSKMNDVLPPLPLEVHSPVRAKSQKSRPLKLPTLPKATVDQNTMGAVSFSAKPASGLDSYHFPSATPRNPGLPRPFSRRSEPIPERNKNHAALSTVPNNLQFLSPIPARPFNYRTSTSPALKPHIPKAKPQPPVKSRPSPTTASFPRPIPLPHLAPPLPSFASDSDSSLARTPSRISLHKTPSIVTVLQRSNAEHLHGSPTQSSILDPRATTSGSLSPLSCSSGFHSDYTIRIAKRVPLFSPITKAPSTPKTTSKPSFKPAPRLARKSESKPPLPKTPVSKSPPPLPSFASISPSPPKPKSRPIRHLSKRTGFRSSSRGPAARDLQNATQKALPSTPLLRSMPDYVLSADRGDDDKEMEIEKLSFHYSPFVVDLPSFPSSAV